MLLTDILLHLDDSENARIRMDVAISLARAHGAELTGIYTLREEPARGLLPGAAAAQVPRYVLEQHRATWREHAEEAIDDLRRRAETAGVCLDYRIEVGNAPTDVLAERARCADVTIIGKPDDGDDSLPHDVLFSTGRPVVVVPSCHRNGVGDNVVVAWNDGREAARAVADAIPVLERARQVTVTFVSPEYSEANEPPGQNIIEHLSRHGITAELETYHGKGPSVGDFLLARTTDRGADLLVMGAYGHSRLRDFVLGGVTKTVLRNTATPVLMSH